MKTINKYHNKVNRVNFHNLKRKTKLNIFPRNLKNKKSRKVKILHFVVKKDHLILLKQGLFILENG